MDSKLIDILSNCGQSHLIEFVKENQEKSNNLQECLQQVESTYPGGLAEYVRKAKILLQESVSAKNPYDGCKVEVPIVEHLDPSNMKFLELESIGLKELDKMVYVLVAGGLGERLGYNGIKVELPVETVTNMTYLEYYCECIKSLDLEAQKYNPTFKVSPMYIMTSDDTYDGTVALLCKNNYFGMADRIHLMKQKKVPAIMDIEGRLAINEDGTLIMKPHGHGDVHQLLYADDKVAKLVNEGKKHIFFFQDTNALCFRILMSALGQHINKGLAMTYICVPRKAKESVGAVCNLVKDDGSKLTINVEYNQLGPLLEGQGLNGDVGDENGLSSYPGNTNILLLDLVRYKAALDKNKGVINEFVNPKYNEDKRTFKSPTRLECMMQDFPKDLDSSDNVGCVIADRFVCFSTLKNNNKDAIVKLIQNNTPECAFSAESDFYDSNVKFLQIAVEKVRGQMQVPPMLPQCFNGVTYPLSVRLVMQPSFAVCLSQIIQNLNDNTLISLAKDSVLVLSSRIKVQRLILDGYLAANSRLSEVLDGRFINAAVKMINVDENDEKESIPIRMRGYKYIHA